MIRLVASVVAALVLLGGCQQSAPPPASVAPIGPLTTQLKAEGNALAAKGDYEAAVVKYLAAVNQEPNDVALRFALAVALSHLDRRDEAIEHFKFVASRGEAWSAEVAMAREWLDKAGALDGSIPPPRQEPSQEAATPSPSKGRLIGKLRWGGIVPRDTMVRMTVTITGEDEANREVTLRGTNFKLGWGYDFKNVPPGTYRVVGENSGTLIWDQKVSVVPAKDTVFDLTDANSLVTPKDFTPSGG